MTKKQRVKKFVKENKLAIGCIGSGLLMAGGLYLHYRGYNKGFNDGLNSFGFPDGGDAKIRRVFESLENGVNYKILTSDEGFGYTLSEMGKLGEDVIDIVGDACPTEQTFSKFIAFGESLGNGVTE